VSANITAFNLSDQSDTSTLLMRGIFSNFTPKNKFFCFSICVVVSQLYPDTQIISALIYFFRFFRANLLSASKLVGWVSWRAWCLSTPN
jgi:hypothetical protein